jgi:hypothetical protein
MNKIEGLNNYGQVADFLTDCDYNDKPIYIKVDEARTIPLDNYEFFRKCTEHDPEEEFPFIFCEEDGIVYFGC